MEKAQADMLIAAKLMPAKDNVEKLRNGSKSKWSKGNRGGHLIAPPEITKSRSLMTQVPLSTKVCKGLV